MLAMGKGYTIQFCNLWRRFIFLRRNLRLISFITFLLLGIGSSFAQEVTINLSNAYSTYNIAPGRMARVFDQGGTGNAVAANNWVGAILNFTSQKSIKITILDFDLTGPTRSVPRLSLTDVNNGNVYYEMQTSADAASRSVYVIKGGAGTSTQLRLDYFTGRKRLWGDGDPRGFELLVEEYDDADFSKTLTAKEVFTDEEGASGNYYNNDRRVYTYASGLGGSLMANFKAFSMQSGDMLRVYNGNTTADPLLGTYSGATLPSILFSSNGQNALTFEFVSNNQYSDSGWEIELSPNFPGKTLYSYTNGDWDNPLTWTEDPNGTISMNPSVPTVLDRVVVLNGDVVKINGNTKVVSYLEIQNGGTLDLGNTSGHNFGTVAGSGLLRVASTQFPSGDFSAFGAAGGGTVELYPSAPISFTQNYTFNNLVLNFPDENDGLILGGSSAISLNLNGNLTVTRGGLQINDNTGGVKTINIERDVKISNQGFISTGTGNVSGGHFFTVKGNFSNNGEVYFCNINTPNYTGTPNNGYVTVTFNSGKADQKLECFGLTNFYKLIVDKGVDDSYMLDVTSSNVANFNLLGRNDGTTTTNAGSIVNNKALEIFAGTLKLGANINIPSLQTGSDVFSIDQDARLWLDGASVALTGNVDRSTLIIYGKLLVSGASNLTALGSQGIILRDAGIYEQTSGNVTCSVFRTSAQITLGSHRGAFKMSGGTMTLTGGHDNYNYASFSLPYPSNVFQMSGNATIDIQASTAAGGMGSGFSLLLNLDPTNAQVAGGTIIVRGASRNAQITSTIPFYDLVIDGSGRIVSVGAYGGYSNMPATSLMPINVLRDFTIQPNIIFNASNQDVNVGRNMLVSAGGTYTPGTNTTRFNGGGAQTYTASGTVNSASYSVEVANSSQLTPKTNLTVGANLSIQKGSVLYDEGNTITVNGNVANSGEHRTASTGSITLAGGVTQELQGDGNGVFGTLIVNKTGGTVNLKANQNFGGNTTALRLASNTILNLASYRLSLGANTNIYSAVTGSAASFAANKMLQTSGLTSDGGVEKQFSAIGSFTYPIGTGTKYRPATVAVNAATQFGKITVVPVDAVHPMVSGTNNALAYYWKTKSENFTGHQVSWAFKYDQLIDVKPASGSEGTYKAAVYRPSTWDKVTGTMDAPNDYTRFNNQTTIDGEYTAGLDAAFGTVETFTSVKDGDWSTASTWNLNRIPAASSIVVVKHKVTIANNMQSCARLTIAPSGVLDLGTTTGHTFTYVTDQSAGGAGMLRLASANFPSGDFADFLGENGGTVEYYGGTYTIPNKATYYNLNFAPNANITHTLSTSVKVFNDFTINGGSGSIVSTPSTAVTIDIGRDLNVTKGTLRFTTPANTLSVAGDVKIDAAGTFTTASGSGHQIYLNGNLNVNGTFDAYASNTVNSIVTFRGADSKVVSGNGIIDFYSINVDKGISPATVLDVTNSNVKFNATPLALNLINGTFRLSAGMNLQLSTSNQFTIPATAALSVNDPAAVMRIGDAASNDGDLLLLGKLELLNGKVYVGPTSFPDSNNDIEIGTGGNPQIDIQNSSELYVNGQVRRNVGQFVGSLKYSQSGGLLQINGKAQTSPPNAILNLFANNERAKLEVLNPGSSFTMSGGEIRIMEGGGVNFGDLLLDPSTSNVTGGKITLGDATTTQSSFRISSSASLYDLLLSDDCTSNVTLSDLVLKNDLTIGSGASFNANSWAVSIGGDMENRNASTTGFVAGSADQKVTFNGTSAGTIKGVAGNKTVFSNLIVSKGGSSLTLQPNSNIDVTTGLEIAAGTLADGGNTINAFGIVKNTSVHQSNSALGGIAFVGSSRQSVYSDVKGTFGNIIMDNPSGIDFEDEFTINGVLTFKRGLIFINENPLTFGLSSSIQNASSTSFIRSNGIHKDKGVSKVFPAAAATFTYPVGVEGKYTPVTVNLASNTKSGSVRVVPIASRHNMLLDLSKPDYLDYNWIVDTIGIGTVKATLTFQYDPSSVKGNVSVYKAGRYYNGNWSPLGGFTDATINTGAKTFTISAKPFVSGEYTLGDPTNFYGKAIYYSHKNGNWENTDTWETKDPITGVITYPAVMPPFGHRVEIRSAHKVTVTTDSRQAYSVVLDGYLDLGTTKFHDLRRISGGGKLIIEGAGGQFNPPGGDMTDFVNSSTAEVIFYGAGTVDAQFRIYPNVTFDGPGEKIIPVSDNSRVHTVKKDLTIKEGTLKKLGTWGAGGINLYGNWINEVGSTGWIPLTSQILLRGNSDQSIITIAGDVESFYDFVYLKGRKDSKLELKSPVDISFRLCLYRGYIATTGSNILRLTRTNTQFTRSTYDVSEAYVDGPMQKMMAKNTSFTFPVGNDGQSSPITVTNTATAANAYWESQYYKSNPSSIGTSVDPTLNAISGKEYWRVKNVTNGAGDKANIQLMWTDYSGMPTDVTSQQKIRAAEWSGTQWMNVSKQANVSTANKTVDTELPRSLGEKYYTLSTEALPIVSVQSVSANAICANESTNLTIKLTGESPWTFRYSIDGGTEKEVSNVLTDTYQLPLSATDLGGVGVHAVKMTYIKDKQYTGVSDFVTATSITVKETPAPVISGKNPAGKGEVGVKYSTPAVAGHTYVWNITGGTITAGQGTREVTVTWGSGTSGTLKLTETVTATGCSIPTDDFVVTLSDIPTPSVSGSGHVCIGSNAVYTTPATIGNTFKWTVSPNGTIVGSSTSNSVTVNWATAGLKSVTVEETKTVGASTLKGTATMDLEVHAYPLGNMSVSDATVCKGSNASITVANSQTGAEYSLYDPSDTKVGLSQNGTGGDIALASLMNTAGTFNYTVKASVYGCATSLTDKPKIIVQEVIPTLSLGSGTTTICSNDAVTLIGKDNGSTAGTYKFYKNGTLITGTSGNQHVASGIVSGDKFYVEVTNALGCSAQSTPPLTFTVNQCQPAKPVTPTTTTNPICQGTASSTVSISAAPAGADANLYVWTLSPSTAGTITGTTASATIAWDAAFSGNATVTVTARNASGSGPVSDALTMTVKPAPAVTWDAANVYKGCADGTTVLTLDNITTGLTYTWSVQDDVGVVSSNSNQPTITWLSNGAIFGAGVVQVSKNVTVVVTGGNGCTTTLTKSVTVYRRPVTGPPYHIGNNIAK